MECRNGVRKASNMLALLSQNGSDLGIYSIKDIGSGGISVIGNTTKLPVNSLVTLQINYPVKNSIQVFEAKAFVVHKNVNFTGLMWVENKYLNLVDLQVHSADSRTGQVL